MTALLTDSESQHARRLAAMDREERLPPGAGIVIALLLGSAMWAVIGIIIYFVFFKG